ncbi:MAG: hypothetical protein AB7F31_04390 [Parachlamydiales bacterium]
MALPTTIKPQGVYQTLEAENKMLTFHSPFLKVGGGLLIGAVGAFALTAYGKLPKWAGWPVTVLTGLVGGASALLGFGAWDVYRNQRAEMEKELKRPAPLWPLPSLKELSEIEAPSPDVALLQSLIPQTQPQLPPKIEESLLHWTEVHAAVFLKNREFYDAKRLYYHLTALHNPELETYMTAWQVEPGSRLHGVEKGPIPELN